MTEEKRYAVYLNESFVGWLNQTGDSTSFLFDEIYIANPERPLLGLFFEDNLHKPIKANVALPAWFSNLLPEGPYRGWIAADTGVSVQREMELLEHVGHDLPGAVRIVREGVSPPPLPGNYIQQSWTALAVEDQPWRFSLAGVNLNLSLLEEGDRLTLPGSGAGGDWIVKFPSPEFADVPVNEFATMTLARESGISVPDFKLVQRHELPSVPEAAWRGLEDVAYATRRFDRVRGSRRPIHMEDFAQLRGVYPDRKYEVTYESIAALCFRQTDNAALLEFVRRLTFNILVSNGDAHLKNWSLIYEDARAPTLAPAYDLVTNGLYAKQRGFEPSLNIAFRKSKNYSDARVAHFRHLAERLDVNGAELVNISSETIDRVQDAWSRLRDTWPSPWWWWMKEASPRDPWGEC